MTGKNALAFFAQITQCAAAEVIGGGWRSRFFPRALREEDSREKKEKFHPDGAVRTEREIQANAVDSLVKEVFFDVKEQNIQAEKKAPKLQCAVSFVQGVYHGCACLRWDDVVSTYLCSL